MKKIMIRKSMRNNKHLRIVFIINIQIFFNKSDIDKFFIIFFIKKILYKYFYYFK